MGVRIGDLLLKAGIITNAQLEEALKYQVIFGGKLGTNLIEMGAASEVDIANALSRKFRVPAADPEAMLNIPPAVVQCLPRDLVEKYRVLPLQLTNRRLTLVMPDPADLKVIDEISFRTGFIVQPQVAAEVRLLLALEKVYGLARDRRYIQVAKELQADRPAPRPAPQEASHSPVPPPVPEEPEPIPPPPADAPFLSDLGEEAEEILDLAEAELVGEEETPATPGPTDVNERLVTARDRDDILDALAAHLAEQFPRSALFLARGGLAMGWKCTVNGKPVPEFAQAQIPLDEPSILKTVAETRAYLLGPIPRSPFNSMVLQELGGLVPESALLVPLVMMGRVVGILYVDGADVDLGERLFDLQKLTAKAAMAFEILVLKNKILSL